MRGTVSKRAETLAVIHGVDGKDYIYFPRREKGGWLTFMRLHEDQIVEFEPYHPRGYVAQAINLQVVFKPAEAGSRIIEGVLYAWFRLLVLLRQLPRLG